jgi:hypothetical protein
MDDKIPTPNEPTPLHELSDGLRPAPLTPDLASHTIPAARSIAPASTSGRMARLAAVG